MNSKIFITDIKTKFTSVIYGESDVHRTIDGYTVNFILNNIIDCTINIPVSKSMERDEIKQYINDKVYG